jgi:hypothetical protein
MFDYRQENNSNSNDDDESGSNDDNDDSTKWNGSSNGIPPSWQSRFYKSPQQASQAEDPHEQERQSRLKYIRELQNSFYSSPSSLSDAGDMLPNTGAQLDIVHTGRVYHLPLFLSSASETITTKTCLEVPGRANVWTIHNPIHTHLFESVVRGSPPYYFGQLTDDGPVQADHGDEVDFPEQPQKAAVLGTLCRVSDYRRLSDGRLIVLIQALERFVLEDIVRELPFPIAHVQLLPDIEETYQATKMVTNEPETTQQRYVPWSTIPGQHTTWLNEGHSAAASRRDGIELPFETNHYLNHIQPSSGPSAFDEATWPSGEENHGESAPDQEADPWTFNDSWLATMDENDLAAARTLAVAESFARWQRYECQNTMLPLPMYPTDLDLEDWPNNLVEISSHMFSGSANSLENEECTPYNEEPAPLPPPSIGTNQGNDPSQCSSPLYVLARVVPYVPFSRVCTDVERLMKEPLDRSSISPFPPPAPQQLHSGGYLPSPTLSSWVNSLSSSSYSEAQSVAPDLDGDSFSPTLEHRLLKHGVLRYPPGFSNDLQAERRKIFHRDDYQDIDEYLGDESSSGDRFDITKGFEPLSSTSLNVWRDASADALEYRLWITLNDYLLQRSTTPVSPVLFGLIPHGLEWPSSFVLERIADCVSCQESLQHQYVRVSPSYPKWRRQKILSYAASFFVEEIIPAGSIGAFRQSLLAIPSTRERLAFVLEKLDDVWGAFR